MAYGQTDDIVELRRQLAESQAEVERLRDFLQGLESFVAIFRDNKYIANHERELAKTICANIQDALQPVG